MGLELAVLGIRKAFWPSDIEVFQELQNDEAIKRRLENLAEESKESNWGAKEGRNNEDQKDGERQGLLKSLGTHEGNRSGESSGAQIRRLCMSAVRLRKRKGDVDGKG